MEGKATSCSAWDIRLSSIQSKLPPSRADWLAGTPGVSDQLIEPFEIQVGLVYDPAYASGCPLRIPQV